MVPEDDPGKDVPPVTQQQGNTTTERGSKSCKRMLAASTRSLGMALIVWAIAGGPLWAWIGVLPLATGLLGWCPAYSLLGINTCPLKK